MADPAARESIPSTNSNDAVPVNMIQWGSSSATAKTDLKALDLNFGIRCQGALGSNNSV